MFAILQFAHLNCPKQSRGLRNNLNFINIDLHMRILVLILRGRSAQTFADKFSTFFRQNDDKFITLRAIFAHFDIDEALQK